MPMPKQRILVTGGTGFIGAAVARRLQVAYDVRIADIIPPSPCDTLDAEYRIGDLRDGSFCAQVVEGCDVVLHFAANMGGMGTIHEENDFNIYRDNHSMTLELLSACAVGKVHQFVFASSACVYSGSPMEGRYDGEDIMLRESDVWVNGLSPNPQGLYGLEKLNTELVLSMSSHQLDIRIARFHNIFGPRGSWCNGREKAPAALLRKALVARHEFDQGIVPNFEIWGDGTQRRSFLYIDDCVDGIIALMQSGCKTAVNIGSNRSVSINDLATIALRCVGLSLTDVLVKYVLDKPLGVAARNSDNSFATEALKPWAPRHTLEDGMDATCKWMSKEFLELTSEVRGLGMVEISKLGESRVLQLKESITFAILLPITSRGSSSSPKSCLDNLRCFATSLIQTCRLELHGLSSSDVFFGLKIFLLIDHDDHVLLETENGMNQAELILRHTGLPVITLIGHHPPGRVCALWRQCARAAYAHPEITYFVLFGDDVQLLSSGWMSTIHTEFNVLSTQKHVPFGFGCVAFEDLSFPGMPSFPVVHRTHLDIFQGEIIPETFVNQDGDPYLFQLYRRWGCSTMIRGMNLRNNVGGSFDARYVKEPTSDWTFRILDNGIAVAEQWLKGAKGNIPTKLLTLDVIVPSFRVQLPLLDRILSLEPSHNTTTMFIIIIDNPFSSETKTLQEKYGHRADIRIRINSANLGASASRNRGLLESAADWVIFLDDDVEPEPDLLIRAEECIRAHPDAAGFVCNVFFPRPDTIYKSALHFSGVTYFWNIAEKIDDDLPWGVTASLIARRTQDDIVFDLDFPKTGGGEDIDFCLRKRKDDFLFFPAPTVRAVHPWWNEGRRSYGRFYGWGLGDSNLLYKFSKFTYQDYTPNAAEHLLLAGLMGVVGFATVRLDLVKFALKFALSTLLANVIHDLYRIAFLQTYPADTIPANPGDRQLVTGPHKVLAIVESTLIRIISEAGKTAGVLAGGRWWLMGRRFDWFLGRWKDGPKNNERKNGLQRTVLLGLILAILKNIF